MARAAATTQAEFLQKLAEAVNPEVEGMSVGDRAASLRRTAELLEVHGRVPSARIVEAVPGRRPPDEAASPGLGASDAAILLLEGREDSRAYLIYELDGNIELEVHATLRLLGPWGTGGAAIPGWESRLIAPLAFGLDSAGAPRLREAEPGDRRRVLELAPSVDLLPGPVWRWEDLPATIRDRSTGENDPYGFDELFAQQLGVELELRHSGRAVGGAGARLLIADARRLGSLYGRLVTDLLAPDAARQAVAARAADPGAEYHPWFPVLQIGGDKAALYTRALIGDLVDKECHLTDPAWLLRVGLYLEWLTCLGIVEAVREDVGDLLTPRERAAFDRSDAFKEIRDRIDPDRWRTVWELRSIAFPRLGTPRAGPVSMLNLMRKEDATLAFLHAHHDDLKHAIALAGPNVHNAQETWARVFRDAERAVLRQTAAAFPELGFLPEQARQFVLHHRQGKLGGLRAPRVVTGLFADRDGLFASACSQYRASMNHVAEWAKARGLMDYTGQECIPREASVLESHGDAPERAAQLQRADGYSGGLAVREAEPATAPPIEDAVALLGEVSIFSMLTPEQLSALAASARPLALGPLERLVIQGQPGDSLFVVADGDVEVIVRRDGGEDVRVDVMGRGAIVGEMSLLTGEPRSATVRADDGALVYEVGLEQYRPLLGAHPEWTDTLAALAHQRLTERARSLAAYDQPPSRSQLRALIHRRSQTAREARAV
jgi:CRP-like cAMP-binding protein